MITVVGSLNMDLVIRCETAPKQGETIIGRDFSTYPGGKGANQAVAAARLGGDVSMIGCVGNDLFGRNLLENLLREGVNVSGIKVADGVSTGVAVITVEASGDNRIILDSGANYRLTPEDIEKNRERIEKSDVLLVQLEIPPEAVEKCLEIASGAGVTTILNPAPARRLKDELLSMVRIITPNETECELLTGIEPNTPEDAAKAAGYFRSKGIGRTVVTAGSRGVYYNEEDRILHKGVPEVTAVDTTAAGDSFSGALAVSIEKGMQFGEAIDFCNMVGTLTVMKEGAQSSLPTLEQVLEWQRMKPWTGGAASGSLYQKSME